MTGKRTFPSLYIPDDAIFVQLFAKSEPTAEETEALVTRAETDFEALYMSAENEYLKNGSAGDLAVAPKDELLDGLYEAANGVAIGEIGTMTCEKDGKTLFCVFRRIAGETGIVPIDRYPGIRERIVNQLLGTKCMDTLREKLGDSTWAVRSEDMIDAVVSAIGAE
jgi:hypothetical protein